MTGETPGLTEAEWASINDVLPLAGFEYLRRDVRAAVEAILAARAQPSGQDAWPCDDYKAPLTCWTVPKGRKTPACDGCAAAFPNGPEVQALYQRPSGQDATAALRARVEAALNYTQSQGVSCGGLTIDADGCFAGDLAARVRAALASDAGQQGAPEPAETCQVEDCDHFSARPSMSVPLCATHNAEFCAWREAHAEQEEGDDE